MPSISSSGCGTVPNLSPLQTHAEILLSFLISITLIDYVTGTILQSMKADATCYFTALREPRCSRSLSGIPSKMLLRLMRLATRLLNVNIAS